MFILYSPLNGTLRFLLDEAALNCHIDLSHNHLDEEEHIDSDVNPDKVQEVPSVIVPLLRVW